MVIALGKDASGTKHILSAAGGFTAHPTGLSYLNRLPSHWPVCVHCVRPPVSHCVKWFGVG